MTTIELKKQLIAQISKVDDVSHLEAIKTLLDTKIVRGAIILSEEQKAALDAARLEAENGQVYTDEEVDKEIRAWLRAK
jgi:predicted transcriptional regulator